MAPATRRPRPPRMAPRPPDSARQVAYDCLKRIDHHGAYANLVLGPSLVRSGLDHRDRKFVTELVYGTVRMRRALDASIDRFVAAEPDPDIRTLLRLGAYQLSYAGVAAHAAVGETVTMAPKRVRGFVNAVLRKVATNSFAPISDAVRLSYPDWIVERLTADLGAAETLATLAAMNEPADVTERADGYVQDLASQWTAAAVGAGEGERVLDVCAAPGGKATAMAASGAFVVAGDVAQTRVGLIAENIAALHSNAVALVADGTCAPFADGVFDRVLLDAPCSGLGSLRRRADARWRITPKDVDDLVVLQRRLLVEAARLVRPGGTLVYSVCTLLAAESIDHPLPDGFEYVTEPPSTAGGRWEAWGSGARLLPHVTGTDGMVLLRYRKYR